MNRSLPRVAEAPAPAVAAGLGERLVQRGLLTPAQLELVYREQRQRGSSLPRTVAELGLITPDVLARVLSEEAQAPLVDINKTVVDQAALNLVPVELCRKFRALPLTRVNGSVMIALADPTDIRAIDTLQQITGLHVEVATAPEQDILAFLDNLQAGGESIQSSIDEIIEETVTHDGQLATKEEVDLAAASQDEAPVIRLVNQIIARAVNIGASDIHFEPA
jgi:hypothetical protein